MAPPQRALGTSNLNITRVGFGSWAVGFEAEQYLEIVNEVFQSPVYAGYGEIIAHERFSPAHFGLTLGLKDVRLFLAAGDEKKVRLPLARLVESHFVAAAGRGMADEDWAALAHLAAENAGLVSPSTAPPGA
jgi:3-hydroxyisobutyrate dehydrogenase-like beta-hydroxyacid dehydrogenase